VVPAADSPGSVDVVVFNSNGFASATNAFRYSTPPVIDGVSPGVLRYDQGGTVTLTGDGFQAEDAGVITVLVDGEQAIDVVVESDTRLTFTAPPGRIFTRASLVVENRRGTAFASGYEYGPGPAGGLLLWPAFQTQIFVYFFDPVSLEVQAIPRVERGGKGGGTPGQMRAVLKDTDGDFLGVDRSNNVLYEIDLVEQTLTEIIPLSFQPPEMARVGTTIYAIDRRDSRFGTVDLATGNLTDIGSENITCCQGFSLAADNNAIPKLYITQQGRIQTISRTTGSLGSALNLNPARHMAGMRFLGSTLYGVTRNGEIITINPDTGATDLVVTLPGVVLSAIETAP
jgi:hypothetical protein